MQIACSPEEFFASFEQPPKSTDTMTKNHHKKQQKESLYDKKLREHLAGSFDNIIPTGIPKNNNKNPSAMKEMTLMPPPTPLMTSASLSINPNVPMRDNLKTSSEA